MRPVIYLHQAKQGAMRRGHPWIFPKAIMRHSGVLVTGQLVDVMGAEAELLGTGVYNEHSLYRVRVLTHAFEKIDTQSIQSIVNHRIRQALIVRRSISLPSNETTAYRLFNSEGDGLSGLTIDRFNNVCVVSSSAYWIELHKDTITQCLQTAMPSDKIVWLAQPKPLSQDGWTLTENVGIIGTERVLEAGIMYQVDFANTQKTGLFIDQRENHQRIGALASGKRVLDLYTYTGGFALHAAKAGAIKVTGVDSSAQAIILAKQNAQLNNLDIDFVEADAREYLVNAGEYDLVVLDPPKLVPSQKHLQRAKNYYRFLHREVFKAMQPGSLLLTCNCSSALSSQDFSELVTAQAIAVGKTVRTIGIYGPASCHPTLASFPEGNYLTAVLLAIV